MTASPSDLLALATPIAREVGSHLRTSLAGAGPSISSKSTPTDLVTDLDTWAESHIVERLLAQRPEDGVFGEEGANRTGTSGVTWCIDPIDGTVNFVHGIPGFCVSIAAQVDGRTVAGVVCSPLHDEVFEAVVDGGATCNGAEISCATPESVARSVVATGFGYDPERRRRQAQVLTEVLPQIADVRRFGAAAVDLCWVACGRVDGYWEVGLNPWDHAAGALIAREAGATVAGFGGEPESEAGIVAAPSQIWDDLAAILSAAKAGAV